MRAGSSGIGGAIGSRSARSERASGAAVILWKTSGTGAPEEGEQSRQQVFSGLIDAGSFSFVRA